MRTRRMLRRAVVGVVALVGVVAPGLATAGAGAGTPASAPHYPVIWSFLPTAAMAASENGPEVAPPGSNIPCRPSAEHPYPVVLVHGLAANQNDNWQTLSPFLADQGYCVFS